MRRASAAHRLCAVRQVVDKHVTSLRERERAPAGDVINTLRAPINFNVVKVFESRNGGGGGCFEKHPRARAKFEARASLSTYNRRPWSLDDIDKMCIILLEKILEREKKREGERRVSKNVVLNI